MEPAETVVMLSFESLPEGGRCHLVLTVEWISMCCDLACINVRLPCGAGETLVLTPGYFVQPTRYLVLGS